MKLKDTPWKKSYGNPRQHIKKQRYSFANRGPSKQGYGFSSIHVWRWELDHKVDLAPMNSCCWTVVLEKTFESPLDCKEINQSILKVIRLEYSLEGLMQSWNSSTLATWCKELSHWKRPWCWERLKVGVEGDDRGWDGWMASPTQQIRVGASSCRWWKKGKPGVLKSIVLQRVGHNWVTEQWRK